MLEMAAKTAFVLAGLNICAFYTTKPSGLGLGLPISRSIIEAHGGRLWVSANVPRGAIFQFRVPSNSGRL
jgi:signal transduction histidine kinase